MSPKDLSKTGHGEYDVSTKLYRWEFAMVVIECSREGKPMAQQEEPEFLLAAMGLEVDHLQASLEQARKLGAKTLVPPMTIPNGTVRVVQNPQGHAAGSGNQPASKLAEIIVWRQLL